MFRLSINDLVPDRAGEVVLFNDSALRSIVLEGVAAPIEEGITRSHRMADGVDVSGFRFIRVRDDLTIFFSPELQLVLSNS